MFKTDDQKWNAVLARDNDANGTFVTAVKTTGIFCKPSCNARHPLRKNVLFFSDNLSAKAAGYRACKRCKPDHDNTLLHDVIFAAASMMDKAAAADTPMPNLSQLAAKSGFSPFHFHRMFRKAIGITPKAYANAAKEKYMEHDTKLKCAQYSYARTTLGLIAVASTPQGISCVLFGETKSELFSELKTRLPKTDLIEVEASDVVSVIVTSIEEPSAAKTLPLDIRGTAFQKRVWQALQKIPVGQTASYSEIAKSMNEPKAMRAVAGACAANPVAVIIPCHRVLRADGGLSGYRWGVERKRELLKRESKT